MDESVLLQSALEYHTSGDHRAAAELYEAVLLGNPTHRECLYMFGCLLHESGNYAAARDLFRRAVTVSPKEPACYNALGLAALELGNYDEAESNIKCAIKLSSRPEFHNSLGTVLKKQGRIPEAIAAYKHALKQDAAFADAYYNLGNCQRLLGTLEQASESFRRAVTANPKFFSALAALGETLRGLKRNGESIPYLERASALAPNDADLKRQLGDAWQDIGEFTQAVNAYRSAVDRDPHLATAWYSCGCAELARKEYAAALRCFQEALGVEPTWLEAEHNLARAFFELGQTDEALTHFRNCGARSDVPNSALARAMVALIIPGAPSADNSTILAARVSWAEQDLPKCSEFGGAVHTGIGVRPLRIGYVSSFFHRPNWMKPVWGLINRHDRSEFEIHLFSEASPSTPLSGYHSDSRDHLHSIAGLANEEVSNLIRGCAIDILVDLNGYSDMRRLPLYLLKPAPIIVGWFNLYATSGLGCFDYLIGDGVVVPSGEEGFYTESVRRVSSSYLSFEVNHAVPEVVDPPCVAKGVLTFGSLASQIKITDQVVAAWSTILSEAPESTLILKNAALGSSATREYMYDRFAKRGVPHHRVRLEGPAEHLEFLRTYNQIDVALDTFPYNGGTTTTEALWQGVPVVTFWGDRWVSRTSASILRGGTLGDFVRTDLTDYISFAAGLSKSLDTPQRLAALRQGMRSQLTNSQVCDVETLTREMENIYKDIVRRTAAG